METWKLIAIGMGVAAVLMTAGVQWAYRVANDVDDEYEQKNAAYQEDCKGRRHGK